MDLLEIRRGFLTKLREDPSFEHKRARLAVEGYPIPSDERELELVVRTLRHALYPGRSGGIH